MQNRLKKAALPLAAALSLTVLAPATLSALTPLTAGAEVAGDADACTPGYWKNHPESWEEFSPGQTVGSAFPGVTSDVTLLQALQGGGGPGIEGAQRILLRAAVASLLNAANDDLEYPLRRNATPEGDYTFEGAPLILFPVIADVYTNGNRARILALANELDRINNSLPCPL
jgi:hypothetical protein